MQTQVATNHADVVFALNQCIETCTDAERGYAAAASDVRDIELKRLFLDRSRQRAEYVIALQRVIESLNAFPENQGTVKGLAHRGWVGLRRVLDSTMGDRAIVEECERGERASLDTYGRAMKRAPLVDMPETARRLFESQLEAIMASLNDLKQRFA
jgi:uncharacterized protein (TIGR02284 family)